MNTGNKPLQYGKNLKIAILFLSAVVLFLFYSYSADAAEMDVPYTSVSDEVTGNLYDDTGESENDIDSEDAEESQTADSPTSTIFLFTASSGTTDISIIDDDLEVDNTKEIVLYTDSADYSEQLEAITEQLLLISEHTTPIAEQLSSIVDMLTYISGILIFFAVIALCKYAYSFFNIFF